MIEYNCDPQGQADVWLKHDLPIKFYLLFLAAIAIVDALGILPLKNKAYTEVMENSVTFLLQEIESTTPNSPKKTSSSMVKSSLNIIMYMWVFYDGYRLLLSLHAPFRVR